jgi:hypothetical protein
MQMHHGLDVRMRGISTSADYTNMANLSTAPVGVLFKKPQLVILV